MKRMAFILSVLYFVSCQQPVPTAETAEDSTVLPVPDSATAQVIDTVSL